MHQEGGGNWEPIYRFTLEPCQLSDYTGRCRYHQTSPESHFKQKRVCTRLTEEWRITIRDERLIEAKNGRRREVKISDDESYLAALEEHFGVRLPAFQE